MPVMITDASAPTGRAVVRALRARGGELRVWLDEDAPRAEVDQLRALGCKVALGTMDDEGRMELALEQVHTVVHLGGGPLQEPEAVLDDAASVLSAALGAGCRRLVWPSSIGVGSAGGNPYLEACAEVEELLADAPLETIVLRRALTYGPVSVPPADALTALLVSGAPTEELGARGSARHEPLFVDDLAGAIVTADSIDAAEDDGDGGRARGSTVEGLHVVVELVGPEVVELGRLVQVLGGPVDADPRRRRRARAAQTTAAPTGAGVPTHLVDLLSRDLLGGPDALGRSGTPLAVGAASL